MNNIILTIDVEDWFQVENFKQHIPHVSWLSYELRVEKNTHRLLDLFDSIESKKTEARIKKTASNDENQASRIKYSDNGQQSTDDGQDEKVRCTFFILGWLAERLPDLVREIHSRGHEVASHGYYHNLCNAQSSEDLKMDLYDSKSILEDIIGNQIYGYRAPSFAINNNILKIIEDCGYLYDSSYNSFALHGRYGQVSLPRNGQKGIAIKINSTKHQKHLPREIFTPLNSKTIQLGHDSDSDAYLTGAEPRTFYELPISNLKFSIFNSQFSIHNFVLPWGGGAYFRVIPFTLFRWGVQSILKKEKAYLFYMHPWEIDPQQPRVKEVSPFFKFRHYMNLKKTYTKLSKLITEFAPCRFTSCKQYLSQII